MMTLMPPAPHLCQVCAVAHEPDNAHNAKSLYYGARFLMLHGRSPTWADAVAHCAKPTREGWERELRARGAWSEPNELQALTELEPWGSAITWHGKDVENRSWIPPRSLQRPQAPIILIHAGKGLTEWRQFRFTTGSADLERRTVPAHLQQLIDLANQCKVPLLGGQALCTVRLAGVVTPTQDHGVIRKAFDHRFDGAVEIAATSPWLAGQGQHGFVLVEAVPVSAQLREDIGAIKGALGFWPVDSAIASRILVDRALQVEARHGAGPVVDCSQPRTIPLRPQV